MLKNYYNLAKPGIIYSNLLTAAAGFFLASRYHVDWLLLLALLIGLACVIASACVFNNVMDRRIDARMTRTSGRAMVTGAISKRAAMIYGIALGVIGILILLLHTNILTLLVAVAAGILYVALYTPLKKRSAYSALLGSIPGAAPPVAGYLAVTHHFDLAALLLFAILVLWQMPHFYAIAIYRIEEYREAGVPVFPIRKGMAQTKAHMLIYMIAFIVAALLLSAFGYTGTVYLVGMLIFGLAWLVMGLQGFGRKTNDVKWARKVLLFSLIVIAAWSVLAAVNPR